MKLYFHFFSLHLRELMQHKASFALLTAGNFITSFSAFLGIWFLMSRFHRVAGYSFAEVLLCFSVVLTSFALAECFARGFDTFFSMIGNGEFDRILVRPVHPIFQVLASKIKLTNLGRLLQAAITLAVAVANGAVDWTVPRVLVLIAMILCGFVFFSSVMLFGASVCFFTTEGLEVMNIFTDGGREFGRYPLSVYGKHLLRLYTYIIPMALFQYYPMLYLTGRETGLFYALAPLFSLWAVIPALLCWKIGVRHYRSTGS